MILSPLPVQKFFGNNGRPLVGGLLFTYAAGTNNKTATYTDASGSSLNTNPVVLDFRGECRLWLDPNQTYKFILSPPDDTDPPTNPIWSVDDISAGVNFDNAGNDTGSANNIIVNIGAVQTIALFTRIVVKVAANNTGPTTLTLNSGTPYPVTWQSGEPLQGGELVVGGVYQFIFDGLHWQLQGPTLQPGDVRLYGAAMDGVTDDTAAFQAASAASLAPHAPAGSTVISGSITLRANQVWTLNGTRISITGDVKVFVAPNGTDDWAILGSCQIIGDNNASGSLSGTGAALEVTGANRWRAYNIAAKNIRGHGIHVIPGTATGSLGDQGRTYGCSSMACYIGYETDPGTGAEYCTNYGFDIIECDTGAKIAAGNTTFVGGNIVENTMGVWLVNGSNHGHGIFSGTNINHNTTQVFADTVTNGHTFAGCHCYQGIIHFDHSTGVVFKGGIVDVDVYRFEESDGCGFIDVTMTASYPNAISNNYNGTESFTVWNNCRTSMGEPWNGALGNIKGVRVTNTLAASQVFSAASVNATAVIRLDDSANESANQAIQTAYDGYDPSTGIYTVVKGGDGKVRASGQWVVTNNAADADKFQIIARHSVLGDFYAVAQPLSSPASSYVFRLDMELPSNATNTLRFMITGSGVANDVTITNSAGTKAYVEGL